MRYLNKIMNSKKGGSLASNHVHRLLKGDCKKGGKRSRAKKSKSKSKSKSKKSKRRTKKPKVVKRKKRTRNKKTKKKMKGGGKCRAFLPPETDGQRGKECTKKIFTGRIKIKEKNSNLVTHTKFNNNNYCENHLLRHLSTKNYLEKIGIENIETCSCEEKDIIKDNIIKEPFTYTPDGINNAFVLPLCIECTEFKPDEDYVDGDEGDVLKNKIEIPRFYY